MNYSYVLSMHIIPLAWAAVVSPTALSVFMVKMSLTENRHLSSFSFYLGTVSVFVVTVFLGIFLGKSPESNGHSDPATIAAIDLSLGIILILLGIQNLFKTNQEADEVLFKYLKIDVNSSTFIKFKRFFEVGLLTFLINFSTVVFVLASGREIGLTKLGLFPDTVPVLFLTIITLIAVEIFLLFFIILHKTAEKIMQPYSVDYPKWKLSYCPVPLAVGLLVIYNGLIKVGMI